MYTIKPIKTDDDHKAAMARIDALWSNQDQDSRNELEVLTMLVSAYEDETIPTDDVDPIDVLKFRMEQMGYTQPDLSRLVGRNRATEVLSRKRPLTLNMIRVLSSEWKIPAAALIKRPRLQVGRKIKNVGRKAKAKTEPKRARAAARTSERPERNRRDA